jgi:hypothetical protein
MEIHPAGMIVPAGGVVTDGASPAVPIVVAVRRRRARARGAYLRGVYLLNARRVRPARYSEFRRRNAGTSNALAASSLGA